MRLQAELLLSWMVNLVVVIVLPIRLGLSSVSISIFLLYCVICGMALTLAEDWRYATIFFSRREVRGYMSARIALVAIFGVCPFLIARTFA